MFRLENIEFIYAFLAIPLLIVFFILMLRWKKNALKKFGEAHLMTKLTPEVSKNKPVIKLILASLALAFLTIAILNPQLGTKLEEVKHKGVDLMIAVDVSNSMNAEDLKPSRLEMAKQAISKLIGQLHNDRLGIIVFAGEAYTQLPITTDYSAARMFLNTISTDIVPTQGTEIGKAIELAMSSFDEEEGKNKAIIIITDGENHDQDAMEWADKAAQQNIVVHTLGMGSVSGAPIPIYKKGVQAGFRTDKDGNTVITRLNESMLRQLAAAGNGSYIRATNAQSGLGILLDEINKMEKKEFKSRIYSDYEDHFQVFLLIALGFLLLEFIISERKSRWLNRFRIWETNSQALKSIVLPLVFIATTFPAFAQSERKDIRSGNQLYQQEKYAEAEKKYLESVEKNQNSLEGAFNIGDALYKQKKYEEAANQFNSLTGRTTDKNDLSKVYHNLGNSYLKNNKYKESIEAYKQALKNNPGDMDTKYNLAYAQQKLKEQQQQQQQNQNQDQKNQDQKNQDQQKQDQKNEQKDKNQEQQKKEEQKQNEQQQQKGEEKKDQQQPKEGQLSKEDAKRLLDAINNEEKNVQDKLKKKKAKVSKMEIEKDW